MGTRLRLRVGAEDRAKAIRAEEAAFRAVARTEDLLSTWRSGTELSRVNTAPVRRPVHVSPELAELLWEAAVWSRRTGGAFDPAVGALVDIWDLRGTGRRPEPVGLRRALRSTGLDCFSVAHDATRDIGTTVTRRCPGAWIDAGAFGKGAALREAARALREAGVEVGILDFGGQLLVLGDGGPGEGSEAAWPVGVARPSRRDETAVRLFLRSGSAATTGQSERGAGPEGDRIGHVLDPRTGRPVPPWGSVTVVHTDPMAADLLSTALFVLGTDEGRRLADRLRVAALFLEEAPNGGARACPSREMAGLLAGSADDVALGCGPGVGSSRARTTREARAPAHGGSGPVRPE